MQKYAKIMNRPTPMSRIFHFRLSARHEKQVEESLDISRYYP